VIDQWSKAKTTLFAFAIREIAWKQFIEMPLLGSGFQKIFFPG